MPGTGSALNANMLLLLGALFCTVAGYFALQPMMARRGPGRAPGRSAPCTRVSAAFFVSEGAARAGARVAARSAPSALKL